MERFKSTHYIDDVIEFGTKGHELCNTLTLYELWKSKIGTTIEKAGERVVTEVRLFGDTIFIKARRVK